MKVDGSFRDSTRFEPLRATGIVATEGVSPKIHTLRRRAVALTVVIALTAALALTVPSADADNKRLNNSVIVNVYTTQHRAGCTNDVTADPALRLAAEWHTTDVLNNRNLDGDIGSGGPTPQGRANAAGFDGKVAETVAINPALAISGIEIMRQWYNNRAYLAIMQDCSNTEMGVWSLNSLDRSVVVAVYGSPA